METAQNTFNGGMLLDTNIATATNSTLSNALNVTLSTFNGNELILQNDMGNVMIPYQKDNNTVYACLPLNYIPIGNIVFGNIMYIASYNKITGYCEIGSFPSPNYENSTGALVYKYEALHVAYTSTNTDTETQSLNTKFFNFDLEHPVEILAESSFDNSVNLILTDNKNLPRLINTGFAVLENNTYQIIDRIGTTNTNRYHITDLTTFDLETSLYRSSSNICTITFNGIQEGGKLRVGNYVFYVILCDKDGNESDIIAESGVIPVFLGTDGDPFSVNGGIENQQSDKLISLTINGLDSINSYIKLCYTRATSANNEDSNVLAYKIQQVYQVTDKTCNILITGYETAEDIAISDLNTLYFNADVVKSLALCLNILFLANLEETSQGIDSSEYETLLQLSLHITPKYTISNDYNLNSNYKYESDEQNSYYSSTFAYNKTGYHFGEIYRFGIIYIRQDNSLTSVFDILGANTLSDSCATFNGKYDSSKTGFFFDSNLSSLTNIFEPDGYNIKGVCRFPDLISGATLQSILGIEFQFPTLDNNFLSKYKGYFFVRQKRIPTLLMQGYATNVCETSFLPSINVGYSENLATADTTAATDNNGKTKLYLYESFVAGAFRYCSINDNSTDENGNTIHNNFFPKRDVSKTLNTYQVVNNYKSRLFTLSDYSYAYLDKIVSNSPVGYYLNECGYPTKGKCQAALDLEEVDVTITDSQTKKSTTTTYAGLVYAVREAAKSTFSAQIYYNDTDNHDMLLFLILLKKLNNNPAPYTETINEDGTKIITYLWQQVANDMNKNNAPSLWMNLFDNETKENNGKTVTLVHSRNNDHGTLYHFAGLAALCNDDYGFGCSYCINNNTLYFNIDGDYYQIESGFMSHKHTWNLAIDSIVTILNDYLTNYNILYPATTSESGLMSDPTLPTFDGKFKYTESYEEDSVKQFLHPMEFAANAIFAPEYELNKPYYNNIFTGQTVKIKSCTEKTYLTPIDAYKSRRYVYNTSNLNLSTNLSDAESIGVEENISLISLLHNQTAWNNNEGYWPRSNNIYFSTLAGQKELTSFKFVGPEFLAHVGLYNQYADETSNSTKLQYGKLGVKFPFNITRGVYGPYIGMCVHNGSTANDVSDLIVNIYIPNYNLDSFANYFNIRFNDASQYQAICDRKSFSDENNTCYRGDCFVNWFTHRVNRNFNDGSAPYNDTIIDNTSFAKGFDGCFDVEYRTVDLTKDAEAALSFNVGDLNAVLMGSWVTFPVRSSMNLSIRSTDDSWTDEKHECGNARSFYPLHAIDASGSFKIPESDCYNTGFSKSGSEKYYSNTNNTVWQNTYYKNRITYSNILVPSEFENGNRVFLATHYRDYTDLYGSITKLIDLSGNLVAICEHGILLIPVNERALAAEGSGGMVYINTSNVLPLNPKVLSDTYGSTWSDSIINTPYGIYGIDTYGKKIWYTNGNDFNIISDFRIQSFLNKALEPFNCEVNIGTVNLKTHYNAFKNDVMFTAYYYDSSDENENVLWNICYNINLAHNSNGWTTFYSWIPSISGNIGNTFLTFNSEIDYNIVNKLDNNINYIWKHGQSDFIPSVEYIKPTFWYGELHPMEIEFVVNKDALNHKIFNNLRIISNNVPPESFHYEIIGDCYNLHNDKPNMFYKLELLKALYQICGGSHIKYNKDFIDISRNKALLIIPSDISSLYQLRRMSTIPLSTMFKWYYSRKDDTFKIYDSYQALTSTGYDYLNLSGAELIYDKLLNLFSICNHVKGVDMVTEGRLRGNMHYKEDSWYVLIPSLNYVLKNELDDGITRINIMNSPIPNDLINYDNINLFELCNKLGIDESTIDIDTTEWTNGRQEMRIKDKYIKIKIRYTGDLLALISGILTLYTNSYS